MMIQTEEQQYGEASANITGDIIGDATFKGETSSLDEEYEGNVHPTSHEPNLKEVALPSNLYSSPRVHYSKDQGTAHTPLGNVLSESLEAKYYARRTEECEISVPTSHEPNLQEVAVPSKQYATPRVVHYSKDPQIAHAQLVTALGERLGTKYYARRKEYEGNGHPTSHEPNMKEVAVPSNLYSSPRVHYSKESQTARAQMGNVLSDSLPSKAKYYAKRNNTFLRVKPRLPEQEQPEEEQPVPEQPEQKPSHIAVLKWLEDNAKYENSLKHKPSTAGDVSSPCAVRRSERVRHPPLEFWRNERLIYQYTETGGIENVGVDPGTTDHAAWHSLASSRSSKKKWKKPGKEKSKAEKRKSAHQMPPKEKKGLSYQKWDFYQ